MSSDELDKWSAEKVMGWALRDDGLWLDKTTDKFPKQLSHGWKEDPLRPEDGSDFYQEPFHPLTDLNQTFMVVEKMREKGWNYEITGYSEPIRNNKYFISFYKDNDDFVTVEEPNNPALAILRAAYKALEGN